MSETSDAPIVENEQVKEFLSILRDNGKDDSGLTALLGYVTSMENQLNKAVDELTVMRRELSGMRGERDHPVRTALEKASRSLEVAISETQERLAQLKEKIVGGCIDAAAEFKAAGAAALNDIARFFRIKPAFESLRNKLQSDIKHGQAAIDKIGTLSTRYHTAGMHLRNAGRALRGKETAPAIKPNGKLAKLAAAPFRTEIRCLRNTLRDAEKAIAALDRLDMGVRQKAAERGEEKPSVNATMKRLQKQIDSDRAESPTTAKAKRKETEL